MAQQSAYEQLQQTGRETKDKLADTFTGGPIKRTVSGWYQQAQQGIQNAENKIKQAIPKMTPTPKAGPAKPTASPRSFHKGGVVKKSGLANVLKGEKVLTVAQQKAAKKKGK